MSKFQEPALPSIFRHALSDMREFDRDIVTVLNLWSQTLKGILDKGISFPDNIDCAFASYTSNAVADTEDTVSHTLGKIPTYFFVGDIDKGGVVYRSGTAFTSSNVFLKCSVATCAVKLLLI
jgi:hypothetical protein